MCIKSRSGGTGSATTPAAETRLGKLLTQQSGCLLFWMGKKGGGPSPFPRYFLPSLPLLSRVPPAGPALGKLFPELGLSPKLWPLPESSHDCFGGAKQPCGCCLERNLCPCIGGETRESQPEVGQGNTEGYVPPGGLKQSVPTSSPVGLTQNRCMVTPKHSALDQPVLAHSPEAHGGRRGLPS